MHELIIAQMPAEADTRTTNRRPGRYHSSRTLCYDVEYNPDRREDTTMSEQEIPLSFPYAHSAMTYAASGLGWPIPSQFPFEKHPPLSGWTGKNGGEPDNLRIEGWRVRYQRSNVLLRLGHNVIGIDVDAYGEKRGGASFAAIQSKHGELPPTYKSSARGNSVSGIYFFRLKPYMDERKAKGDFGPGSDIEVVRYSHRYTVVYPSWHQGAEARYMWYRPDGSVTEQPPVLPSLPYLPDGWWDHVTQKCSCFERQREERRRQIARYKNRPSTGQGAELAKIDFEHGINELARMPEGGRNNYLSKLAGRTFLFDVFLNGVLDLDWVEDRLWVASETCGLDEQETKRTIESALAWATDIAKGEDE